MTMVTEAMREGFLVNVDGEEIRAHKIDCSVNGCPRYVVHFVSLNIALADYGKIPGLTKYNGKWFGGGYVIQSYNLDEDLVWCLAQVAKYYINKREMVL